MQNKDPKPEIARLEELALQVQLGEIKLPRFQRPFVWKQADMLKLLDSIYKGYPIGSILLWNSSQRLMSERTISGFDVNSEENLNYPTNYLLDGQQRLTTLCGSLFWNGTDTNSIWNIHFDLDKEEFVYPKEKNLINIFPLNKLIKTEDFIKQCMKFDHHNKKSDYFKVAERLLKSLKDYKIAVVKIGDMTLDEVAPIFERINSTGRKLTMVDLMMAATWSDGFDLTKEIQSIKDKCAEIEFGDIEDSIILRTIAACSDLGINKEDIQRLRQKSSEELTQACQFASDCILKALLFFKEQFDIHNFGYIPYGFQFTYIAEFFRLNTENNPSQITHLSEWFWYTSITRYFASKNTGEVAKDLALIRSYAMNRELFLFNKESIDISQLLYDKFIIRNATSVTFTLILNFLRPEFTIDGRAIDGGHKQVKASQYFLPFSPNNGKTEKLNISRIIHPYNNFSELSKDYLSQHFLNEDILLAKDANDSFIFIYERSRLIESLVKKLTGCYIHYTMPDAIIEESYPEIEVEDD